LKILNIPAVRIFSNLFLNSFLTFSTKQKCSKSPENSTNRLDDIKCVPNLVSDRFFDFSQKKSQLDFLDSSQFSHIFACDLNQGYTVLKQFQ